MLLLNKNGKLWEHQSGKEVTGMRTSPKFQATEKEFSKDVSRKKGKVQSYWVSVFTHNIWPFVPNDPAG